MKRLQKLAVFLLALLLVTVPALAAAPTKADKKEAERQELRTKTYQALKLLYEKKPKSKRAIEHAYGYAVFVDTSYTAGFIGGGHGRGRAVNNSNGTEVFMKMAQGKLGLGLGVRSMLLPASSPKAGHLADRLRQLPRMMSMVTALKGPSR